MYTSEKENIIRHRWLGAFYVYAFWILLYYGFYMSLACYQDVTNNTINTMQKNNVLTGFIFIVLIVLLFVHYYFGYKKRGTRLLAWMTIIGGLKFISKIPATVSDVQSIFVKFGLTNFIINCGYVLEIGGLLICTYYLINCWKLYSLNSAIKHANNKNKNISDSECGEKVCRS